MANEKIRIEELDELGLTEIINTVADSIFKNWDTEVFGVINPEDVVLDNYYRLAKRDEESTVLSGYIRANNHTYPIVVKIMRNANRTDNRRTSKSLGMESEQAVYNFLTEKSPPSRLDINTDSDDYILVHKTEFGFAPAMLDYTNLGEFSYIVTSHLPTNTENNYEITPEFMLKHFENRAGIVSLLNDNGLYESDTNTNNSLSLVVNGEQVTFHFDFDGVVTEDEGRFSATSLFWPHPSKIKFDGKEYVLNSYNAAPYFPIIIEIKMGNVSKENIIYLQKMGLMYELILNYFSITTADLIEITSYPGEDFAYTNPFNIKPEELESYFSSETVDIEKARRILTLKIMKNMPNAELESIEELVDFVIINHQHLAPIVDGKKTNIQELMLRLIQLIKLISI